MNNKITIISAIIIIIAVITAVFFLKKDTSPYGNLDEFAKCLAEKEVTMYGAYWCSHCKSEKARFGSSFKYVPYVECTEETKLCLDKEVNVYPTWIIGSSTEKYEGELGLEKISELSKCVLPNTGD